jgi:predicted amidohydrolase YtcJ
MRVWTSRAIAIALALIVAPHAARAQTADTVLVNGKVVTVDDRFSIAQALAIRGNRIVKVGTSAEIEALKGPSTRTIDLAGRTVIPGLIDNHAHWVRAAEHDELRFDGVTSRQQALKMLAERVSKTPAGGWVVVLGGWSEEQFTDEPKGFFARRARPHRAQQSGGAASGL